MQQPWYVVPDKLFVFEVSLQVVYEKGSPEDLLTRQIAPDGETAIVKAKDALSARAEAAETPLGRVLVMGCSLVPRQILNFERNDN